MSGMSMWTCTERCIAPISLSDSELCELYESLFSPFFLLEKNKRLKVGFYKTYHATRVVV